MVLNLVSVDDLESSLERAAAHHALSHPRQADRPLGARPPPQHTHPIELHSHPAVWDQPSAPERRRGSGRATGFLPLPCHPPPGRAAVTTLRQAVHRGSRFSVVNITPGWPGASSHRPRAESIEGPTFVGVVRGQPESEAARTRIKRPIQSTPAPQPCFTNQKICQTRRPRSTSTPCPGGRVQERSARVASPASELT